MSLIFYKSLFNFINDIDINFLILRFVLGKGELYLKLLI